MLTKKKPSLLLIFVFRSNDALFRGEKNAIVEIQTRFIIRFETFLIGARVRVCICAAKKQFKIGIRVQIETIYKRKPIHLTVNTVLCTAQFYYV